MTSSLSFMMLVLGKVLPSPVLLAVLPYLDSVATSLAARAAETTGAAPFASALPGVLPIFGLAKLFIGVVILAGLAVALVVAVGAVIYFTSPKCTVAGGGGGGACRAG